MTWQPCGYGCGKPWRPWLGTRLIGHARCAVTPEVQDAILASLEGSTTSLASIAEQHDVTLAVVRAWIRLALQRREQRSRKQRLSKGRQG